MNPIPGKLVESVFKRVLAADLTPELQTQLAAAGLVDEICLSTSPLATAATLPVLGDSPFDPIALRLELLLLDADSSLYARWVRASQSASTDS